MTFLQLASRSVPHHHSTRLAVVVLTIAGGACASDDTKRVADDEPERTATADASSAIEDSNAFDAGSTLTLADAGEVIEIDATPKTCADLETTPARTIPSVTFLVDGSGSMSCVYPEDPSCSCDGQQQRTPCKAAGTTSRWQALSQALLGDGTRRGVVEELGKAVRFGLWIYHNPRGAKVCPSYPVQIAPALDQYGPLKVALPAKPPGDNTPTALALAQLVSALPNAQETKDQALGPQKIVLATDGQPFTCQDPVTLNAPLLDYQAVLDATQTARAKEIDLFVMSLAPAAGDFAAHLERVAREGNTAHAYTPANPSELSAALEDIIASAISCTLTLNGKVQKPERCRGRALLGGSELRCGDEDGFVLRDATHVELRGEACRRFKHEPGIALDMTFPCDGFELE